MGNEAAKVKERFLPYLEGLGIDIGCGSDPITSDCMRWDQGEGDAQLMTGLSNTFDWVFSSHCLEHLVDPTIAINRWWELVNPSGYLLIVVPDEDLYEQGIWPSRFNGDHKKTFSPDKSSSWSPAHVNVMDLIRGLPDHKLINIHVDDTGYDYTHCGNDQTAGQACAHIELIVQKAPFTHRVKNSTYVPPPNSIEISFGGFLPTSTINTQAIQAPKTSAKEKFVTPQRIR